jgi:hypothetical protein
VSKDSGPLAKLGDRIRAESPLPVFPFQGSLTEDDHVLWKGDDPVKFLELAKSVGARMIYLNDVTVEPGDTSEGAADHVGETSAVEAAFLVDGEFHVFLQVADWVPEDGERPDSDVPAEEVARAANIKLLREQKDNWIAEFVDGLRKRSGPVDTSVYWVDTELRTYLHPKLSLPVNRFSGLPIPRDGSELDQVIRSLAMEVSVTLTTEEHAKMDPLVPECAGWARGLGMRTLSKSDVDAFLLERRLSPSGEGRRYLWTKAKLAVKVSKGSA